MLTDLTGFTPWAVQARDGMPLAAQEINAAGGVDGRMIEIGRRGLGERCRCRCRRLRAAGRGRRSGRWRHHFQRGRRAVAPLAEQVQVPAFLVKSGTQAALTADSRYTFRTCLPQRQWTLRRCSSTPRSRGSPRSGPSSPTTLGTGVQAGPWRPLSRVRVDYGTIEVAPVPPDTDFTPFVRAMADFGAEMIIATGHPPGNSAIVRLSADLIGNVPVTGAWIPPDLAVGGL